MVTILLRTNSLIYHWLCLALWLPTLAQAVVWNQTTSVSGQNFFDYFEFSTGEDASTSLSDYQSASNAKSKGLAYTDATTGAAVIKVDDVNTYPKGIRPTVRLESKYTYGDGVYIFDLGHIPVGCATWPSLWTRPRNSDSEEIDIFENTNDQYSRGISVVHTLGACSLNKTIINAEQTGLLQTTDCSISNPANTGCRVNMTAGLSITELNEAYPTGNRLSTTLAMERSFGSEGKGVRFWTWTQDEVPAEVSSNELLIDPDTWGTPASDLPITECGQSMQAHMIIMQISLCGSWTTSSYPSTGCTAYYETCQDQVINGASVFNSSYFAVNSMKLYTHGGGLANSNVVASGGLRTLPSVTWLLSALASVTLVLVTSLF